MPPGIQWDPTKPKNKGGRPRLRPDDPAYKSVFKERRAVQYLSPTHRALIRVNVDGCVYRKLPWTHWHRIGEPAGDPEAVVQRYREIVAALPAFFRDHRYFPPMLRMERWAREGRAQSVSYRFCASDGCSDDGAPAWTLFFGYDRLMEYPEVSPPPGSGCKPRSRRPHRRHDPEPPSGNS